MKEKEYKMDEILGFCHSLKDFAYSINAEFSINQFEDSDTIVGFSPSGELIIHTSKNVIQYSIEKKYQGGTFSMNADFIENPLSSPILDNRTYHLGMYDCTLLMYSKIPLYICSDIYIHTDEFPNGSRWFCHDDDDVIFLCEIPIVEELIIQNQIIQRIFHSGGKFNAFDTIDIQIADKDAPNKFCPIPVANDDEDYSIMDFLNQDKIYEILLWCPLSSNPFSINSISMQHTIFEQIFYTIEDLGLITNVSRLAPGSEM